MAYRFDGTDDYVEFNLAPIGAYTIGAITSAILFKRTALANEDGLLSIVTSGTANRAALTTMWSDNKPFAQYGGLAFGPTALASTTPWYLLVVSRASGSGITPRFHLWNGSAWSHGNGSTSTTGATLTGTDRLIVGVQQPPPGSSRFAHADIVCVGIKKADVTDGTAETLSPTSFQSWRDFGFDWLIGFDSSLESAGVLQDQASPGTGDEIAIVGTTAVSDPAGWAWTSAVTPVANFTATPTSGAATLAVTFTDTSTNTPTSWAWTFGDGGTSTSQNPSHNYTAPGTYNVQLTATNAAGNDVELKTGYINVGEAVVYAEAGGITIG